MRPIRGGLLAAVGAAVLLVWFAPVLASAEIVRVKSWGGQGSGAGRLSDATQGIATDSRGHVYVVDYDRVQKFAPSGRFLLAWGWGVRDGQSEFQTCRSSCQRGIVGEGKGQFDDPVDLAFDSTDHAYVSDWGNSRIQKFTANGRFLTKWGRPGSGDGEFGCDSEGCYGSRGLALGRRNRVFVADPGNAGVQKFSPGGRFLAKWKTRSAPNYLAADTAGHVYLTHFHDNVDKFSAKGQFLVRWGWGVADGFSRRFQRCQNPLVACYSGFGGSGDGQFFYPHGVATDAYGNVYVADSFNERIQKFSAHGRFLTSWGVGGERLPTPIDVAVDSAGHVYVLDTGRYLIVKYAQIPPQTTITDVKLARRRAEFRFKASEPDSSFKCGLDGRRLRPCDSPKTYRHLGVGGHVFTARASDTNKLKDQTPAKKRFWIAK